MWLLIFEAIHEKFPVGTHAALLKLSGGGSLRSGFRGSGCLFLVIVKLPRVPSLLTTITAAWTSSLQINVSVTFSSIIVNHRSNLSQCTIYPAFNIASENSITVLCNA